MNFVHITYLDDMTRKCLSIQLHGLTSLKLLESPRENFQKVNMISLALWFISVFPIFIMDGVTKPND